jgi:hypothetical protein
MTYCERLLAQPVRGVGTRDVAAAFEMGGQGFDCGLFRGYCLRGSFMNIFRV